MFLIIFNIVAIIAMVMVVAFLFEANPTINYANFYIGLIAAILAYLSMIISINAFIHSANINKPKIKLFEKKDYKGIKKPACYSVEYKNDTYLILVMSVDNLSPTRTVIKDFFTAQWFFPCKFPFVKSCRGELTKLPYAIKSSKEFKHLTNIPEATNRIVLESYDSHDLYFAFKLEQKKSIFLEYLCLQVVNNRKIRFILPSAEKIHISAVENNQNNDKRNTNCKKQYDTPHVTIPNKIKSNKKR